MFGLGRSRKISCHRDGLASNGDGSGILSNFSSFGRMLRRAWGGHCRETRYGKRRRGRRGLGRGCTEYVTSQSLLVRACLFFFPLLGDVLQNFTCRKVTDKISAAARYRSGPSGVNFAGGTSLDYLILRKSVWKAYIDSDSCFKSTPVNKVEQLFLMTIHVLHRRYLS